MIGRKILATLLVAVCLVAIGSAHFPGVPPVDAAEPEPPVSGEELWQSLPPELLSNVIEGKMEEMSEYQSRIRRLEAEIARVKEIQASNACVARPPPE